jgi:hypothetical protein
MKEERNSHFTERPFIGSSTWQENSTVLKIWNSTELLTCAANFLYILDTLLFFSGPQVGEMGFGLLPTDKPNSTVVNQFILLPWNKSSEFLLIFFCPFYDLFFLLLTCFPPPLPLIHTQVSGELVCKSSFSSLMRHSIFIRNNHRTVELGKIL